MKRILMGTVLGFLIGAGLATLLVVAWDYSFDALSEWQHLTPKWSSFWNFALYNLRRNGLFAILEGGGWGAMIGTTIKGFQVLAETVRASNPPPDTK